MDSRINRKALAWTVGMTLAVHAALGGGRDAGGRQGGAHAPSAWQSAADANATALH